MNGAPGEIEHNEEDVTIEDGHIVHKQKKEEGEVDMEKVERDNVEYDD
jgi:hypothetical protein